MNIDYTILFEILENIPSAIYIIDINERLIYVNHAAEIMDNFTREDILGKKLKDVYKDISFAFEKDSLSLATLRNHQLYTDENVEWYSNGSVVNALTSTYFIKRKGQTIGVYTISDNITNMKRRIISNGNFGNKYMYPVQAKKLNNGTIYTFESILGNSSVMKNTISIAKRFASKKKPIMIYGETGTGKEMFAQSIHNSSPCYEGPFVAINCAAIPDTLLESTLFGTVKGAFTGAIDSVGLFEKSNQGSLFLDEINSLPLSLQAKLLRVLQEKEVRRIGDNKVRKINCRIISATNVPPDELLRKGTMREDLYYRLSTGLVFIPALRIRGNDLDILIKQMIQKLNEELETIIIGLTPALSSMLHLYQWPGNVRELSNVLESAFNMINEHDGYLGIEHLPSFLFERIESAIISQQGYQPNYTLPMQKNNEQERLIINKNINYMVDFYEKQLIEQALIETQGKLTTCSKFLGISRQSLSVKLKKYKINPNNYK